MKRSFILSIGIAAGIFLAMIAFVLYQHSYAMTEEKVEIETPQGVLKGTLVLPKAYTGTIGLVVFVHGDGPINSSYSDGYKPLWEELASAGYASLSFSKPGVDGSEGNWLEQSMEDRAQEATAAINWAKTLPMIDDQNIGLWGASQAGWVIPKIVRDNPDIAFSILVSPAINWIDQGKYNTRKELVKEGNTQQQIDLREAYNAHVLSLLQDQASYDDYLKIAEKDHIIPKERWAFILKNFRSDATEELSNFRSPVHLVLGGQDLNVDVENTDRVYRQHIPASLLSVSFLPEADHSMLKKDMVDSEFKAFLTGVFFPRKLVDAQYLTDLSQFVIQK